MGWRCEESQDFHTLMIDLNREPGLMQGCTGNGESCLVLFEHEEMRQAKDAQRRMLESVSHGSQHLA